jgi:hypothetical protein
MIKNKAKTPEESDGIIGGDFASKNLTFSVQIRVASEVSLYLLNDYE